MEKVLTDREFLNDLMISLTEKRSDVSDLIEAQLHGRPIDIDKSIEHRYIQANIPGTDIRVEYDTLTTQLSFHRPLCQWEFCINHTYED